MRTISFCALLSRLLGARFAWIGSRRRSPLVAANIAKCECAAWIFVSVTESRERELQPPEYRQ